jgi:hypothetical protein
MDPAEAQSRATIAAALIMRGAVAVPCGGTHLLHADGLRLRELTDDIYRLVTALSCVQSRRPHERPRAGAVATDAGASAEHD